MNSSATDKAVLGIASSACISCKERKQKCDKSLPSCSRCERLLLICWYQKLPSPAPSLDDAVGALNSRNHKVIDINEALLRALTSAGASSHSCLPSASNVVKLHKQQFEEMVITFFNSYHKWIPIVHEESFREGYHTPQPDTSRGFTTLVLSMCLLTRPLMNERRLDPLRVSLYPVLKRTFWDPDSVARPTLHLIQSGVLLSLYEYGQGMADAAYITICTCLSMAQVCGLNRAHQSALPVPEFWTRQVQGKRTWWAILIHERMISLKTGALLRPLHIKPSDEVSDVFHRSELEDPLSISFYCEARAAAFLDQVLNLIRDPVALSSEGQFLFQALDRSLLLFLKYLIQQYLGFCCEAVAIGLSAFMQLHQWRLSISTPSTFSAQDRLQSSDAIEAVIKIIVDTGRDVGVSGSLFCHSPYSIHVIYQILLTIRHLQENGREHLDAQIEVLGMMLEHQRGRWKIAGDYIENLSGK